MSTQEFEIIRGNAPGKWDLAVALFSPTRSQSKLIKFLVRLRGVKIPTKVIEVGINDVSMEDGSGESWCLTGWLKNDRGDNGGKVSGHFRTDSRHGYLKIEKS